MFGAARLFEQAGDYAGVVEWLKELDPAQLDANGRKAADGKEWASDREAWHLHVTKALDKLGRWADLHDACQQALQAGVRFHNSQDVWVRYRLARAHFRLGQGDTAAEQLRELLGRSPQPPILAGYAAVLVSLGRSKEAIPQYARALNGARDLGMGAGWLSGLALCLEDVGELALAALHLRLCLAVRQEKGWPIGGELQELAARLGVSGEVDDIRSLSRTLRPKWDEWQRQSAPQMTGTVKTLLPNGKAGFIRGEDGVDYYFPLRDIRGGRTLALGDVVEFEPYERFDPRKDQMSPAARHVQGVVSSEEPFARTVNRPN